MQLRGIGEVGFGNKIEIKVLEEALGKSECWWKGVVRARLKHVFKDIFFCGMANLTVLYVGFHARQCRHRMNPQEMRIVIHIEVGKSPHSVYSLLEKFRLFKKVF